MSVLPGNNAQGAFPGLVSAISPQLSFGSPNSGARLCSQGCITLGPDEVGELAADFCQLGINF